jgi:hypothetical protein
LAFNGSFKGRLNDFKCLSLYYFVTNPLPAMNIQTFFLLLCQLARQPPRLASPGVNLALLSPENLS